MKLLAIIINILYKLRIPFLIFFVLEIEEYLWQNPGKIKIFLNKINPGALWKIADTKLIFLVQRYLKNTPAFKNIKKNNFPNSNLDSLRDFKRFFPFLDKENYVKKYSMEELSQNGRLPRAGSLYKSAGTSGPPTLWAESIEEELSFDKAVSFIASTMMDMAANEYVILNCWALGSWPTGINFAVSSRFHGKIVNIGTNLKEAINVLKIVGPKYNYLLAGYPPFIYNLIEECGKKGIHLSKYSIDIVSGGEGFVEEWRNALIKKLGPKRAIFSVYGSTDKGLGEGLETNLAYIVRSLLYVASTLLISKRQAKEIMQSRFLTRVLPFSEKTAKEFLLSFLKREENIQRLPMVFQFDPTQYYNENYIFIDPDQKREVNEFLSTILSPSISMPRVRYNIHDEGFIMNYEEVAAVLKKHKINIKKLNMRQDLYLDLHLPFLFVFGRTDGTISVDGANIFPEDIDQCLRLSKELYPLVNSFQLFTEERYRFGVAIELKDGITPSSELVKKFKNHLKKQLPKYSFGYKELTHEGLRSANMALEVYAFCKDRFCDRTIKMRYVKH
jgi:phenylacetate-coenzyme A ligase PaaK-like adenylate-forming protein